ncbi:hypothetical protein KSS87_022737 [Heliosperma pusillum]|nr:hypothetical protein KSS87_022737 [Heliosperma pusillum]
MISFRSPYVEDTERLFLEGQRQNLPRLIITEYLNNNIRSEDNLTGITDLHNVKTIRLLIYNDKYLTAHEDGESVIQGRNESQKQAYWTVEHLPSVGKNLVRLKSSYQNYLTATDDNFLLGATGKKVKQTPLKWLDYSIEWELIMVDNKVKLKTWNGNFLKANGGLPPWRNSVTHDHSSVIPTASSMLWEIEVFDVYEN